jgi:DNA-directed RNA polymerase subunit M
LPDVKKKKLVCGSCGKSSKTKGAVVVKEELKGKKNLEVIDKDIDVNPEIEEECPKCTNKKARFWTLQTRAGDEAETRFYECTKCKHRWREY